MKAEMKNEIKKNKRIEIVDFLRGLAVITMILYHIYYDIVYIFGREISIVSPSFMYIVQQFSCSLFIFLAGFSINLSTNSFKNAIKILFFAYLLTLVTYLVVPEFVILFGILHFLGFSILLVTILGKLIDIKNTGVLMILSGISFLIFLFIKINTVDFFSFSEYLRNLNLYPLGFYGNSFNSSDYFPLLPWFFLFLMAYLLGKINMQKGNPIRKFKINIGIINKMGRHSLIIYMLHQVIIAAFLYVLFMII